MAAVCAKSRQSEAKGRDNAYSSTKYIQYSTEYLACSWRKKKKKREKRSGSGRAACAFTSTKKNKKKKKRTDAIRVCVEASEAHNKHDFTHVQYGTVQYTV